MIKNLPAMQETQGPCLGGEDLLKKGMAIHSSILAWRNPWTEEPGRLQSMRSQRVGHNCATNIFTFTHKTMNIDPSTPYENLCGEFRGQWKSMDNSPNWCLENSTDRGACQVDGVAKSQM